jgi:ribosomal protein S12 methylthiotransferase
MVSRPLETLITEAHTLTNAGVRELVLIAQDTTDYGHDLGIRDGLSILLERLTNEIESSSHTGDTVKGLDWIRIMYAFPGYITDRLIEVMATRPQVLPYLDLPLQHAHPGVLKRMGRPANMDWVHTTIDKMRQALPNLAIRTAFIVGFPGETEHEFKVLYDFVREMRFDHVGTFQFSFEAGTPSSPLGDPIPAAIKEERYQKLMELQQGISLQVNQAFVGQVLDVLIEGQDNGLQIGRSFRDAPEIDGLVLAEGEASVGDIVPVRITGAMAYDLTGVISAS